MKRLIPLAKKINNQTAFRFYSCIYVSDKPIVI